MAPVPRRNAHQQGASNANQQGASNTQTSGTPGTLDANQQAALDAHNAARNAKGTPSLQWDTGLAQAAQDWAYKNAAANYMEHAGNGVIDCLASWEPTPPNPYLKATQMWLSEQPAYQRADASVWNQEQYPPGDWGEYGHYAVVMSKLTTKVGMGWAKGANDTMYCVARYDPGGNFYFMKEYP